MTSTHDLIAGRCQCGAPVRLFCSGCARYQYWGEAHRKDCKEEAQVIRMCQCLKPEIQWGQRPHRFVRPKTHEDTLFPLPPRVEG